MNLKVFVLTKNSLILYSGIFLALLGIFVVGSSFGDSVFTAASSASNIPIYCVEKSEPKIAITFDAAWGDEDTDQLITVLNNNGAKASFFMVGGFINRFPASVKKFHDAGHEILNHSDTHAHLSGLSEEEIITEITGCEEKITSITGTSKKLFRAPYGEYTDDVIKIAEANGYKVIQWDVDSLDWKDLSPDEICKRVTDKVKNGSILLFHNGAANTPAALEKLLPILKEKGFDFVPVSELIYQDNYHIDHEGRQISDGAVNQGE